MFRPELEQLKINTKFDHKNFVWLQLLYLLSLKPYPTN